MIEIEKQIDILRRGAVDFISAEGMSAKLQKKKRLRVKLGVDPTSPDIHLGHTVVLQKLRRFQDLGHQAVLIIGDYTALVGDPSGVQKTRPQLTAEEIERNARTYFTQVQKILEMKTLEIRYNGEWFQKMSFQEVIQLASRMTVARMLERDDFSKRFKKGSPIAIHEFIYPLMQGYDSLMVKADVELGGTDQLFNLLVGRQLQKEDGLDSQIVITTPLLEGTDGVQKMSKSLNNYIGVADSADDIYGKVMSISDTLMWKYYELLSGISLDDIKQKRLQADAGKLNPKHIKMELAKELVERFYSKKDASEAQSNFERIFQKKQDPIDIETVILKAEPQKIFISKIMVAAECAVSNTEARRLIEQGAVFIDHRKIMDPQEKIDAAGEFTLKVGKRRFKKVIFK